MHEPPRDRAVHQVVAQLQVVDDAGKEAPRDTVGRLAVRGPTGCRYLADERQASYVQGGWNLTGDAYRMDEDGYLWYQARTDDMIISAGYNISGPEVEAVLLDHPKVQECAVIGAPDVARGQIVKAFVVPREPADVDADLARELQDFVKAQIAPYKYPRAIEFVASLPRTETGKVQRFRLREIERERAAAPLPPELLSKGREREGTREAGRVRGAPQQARCGGSPLTSPLLGNGSPPLPPLRQAQEGEENSPSASRDCLT